MKIKKLGFLEKWKKRNIEFKCPQCESEFETEECWEYDINFDRIEGRIMYRVICPCCGTQILKEKEGDTNNAQHETV